MTPNDIKKGDIVTYRNEEVNHVNKVWKYQTHFNKNFKNKGRSDLDIMKIQRYVRCLFFYRLKTIYKRK